MKRLIVLLLLVIAVALGGSLEVAAGRAGEAATPVYTVAQARALLARHASAWLGRTILVRGIVEGPFVFCGASRPCPPPTLGLIDDANSIVGPGQYLPVRPGTPDRWWAALRQVPALDMLIPAPQRLRFGLAATYRLQLRAAPALCARNGDILCYEGLVVDAAPAA